MQIRLLDPLLVKAIMAPHPLRHRAPQHPPVRVRDPRSVEPPGAQTPRRSLLHSKDPLLGHPLEHTIPQPVRAAWVFGISRTVGRPRDLDNHRRPPALQELVRPLRVIRAVAVETCDEENRRRRLSLARGRRDAVVDWDAAVLLTLGVRVGDTRFDDRIGPLACGLEVDFILELEGPVLEGRVDVRETGNAVEAGDAEVETGGEVRF